MALVQSINNYRKERVMKRTRDWRRKQEQRIIENRLKLIKHVDPEYAEYFEKNPHKLAKHKPLSCGNSKCPLCHPEKYVKSKNTKDYHYYKDHPDEDLEDVA